MIAPDAISQLVPHFSDPEVGAGGGQCQGRQSREPVDPLAGAGIHHQPELRAPRAEHAWRGQRGARRHRRMAHAGGARRRRLPSPIPWPKTPTSPWRCCRHGYQVQYEDRALAYTEAPTTANGLMRQRFRWSFGILQAVWKHRSAFARKGALGWVALPNIVIFQILLPLVSPFIDLMFVVGALDYLGHKHFHPETRRPGELPSTGGVLRRCSWSSTSSPPRLPSALERREAAAGEDVVAAGPRLAATLRLPPVVLPRAVQDAEARHRWPPVLLGQTGAHRGGNAGAQAGGGKIKASGALPLAAFAKGGDVESNRVQS